MFYGKGPFPIQITSYQFVYSFVEGQPAKGTLRKSNVTFEKTGIKTDRSIQETLGNRPNNSLKCHHHCTKYKFEVKTPTLENFQE